jgi:hypothetical protein
MREHGSILDDLKDLHRWMTEIDSDNEHQFGPGLFDFTPDWSGSVLRAWLRRLFRRGS